MQVGIADYVAGYCRRLFGDRQTHGPERVAKKQPGPIEVARNARRLECPHTLDIFVEPDSKQIFLALLLHQLVEQFRPAGMQKRIRMDRQGRDPQPPCKIKLARSSR